MKLLKQLSVIVLIVLILIAGIYYFALWATHDYSANFLKADSCLDSGGVYQYEANRCWMPGDCEDEGGNWNGTKVICEK